MPIRRVLIFMLMLCCTACQKQRLLGLLVDPVVVLLVYMPVLYYTCLQTCLCKNHFFLWGGGVAFSSPAAEFFFCRAFGCGANKGAMGTLRRMPDPGRAPSRVL